MPVTVPLSWSISIKKRGRVNTIAEKSRIGDPYKSGYWGIAICIYFSAF